MKSGTETKTVMDERLINRKQLAEMLGIHERSVPNLVESGDLPKPLAIRGSRRWMWSRVLEHIDARQDSQPGRNTK